MVDQIIALVRAGDWFGVAFIVLSLIQTWIQPSSKFPWTVPDKFQPVVAALTGQLYAVLLVAAAHQSWYVAALHGLLATLAVLFASHAIWETGNAPSWVKWLAMIIEELKPDAHSAATPNPPVPPKASRPPPKLGVGVKISGALLLCIGGLWVFLGGCLSQKQAEVAADLATDVACVFEHDGEPIAKIIQDCRVDGEQTVIDLLAQKHKVEAKKLEAAHCAAEK